MAESKSLTSRKNALLAEGFKVASEDENSVFLIKKVFRNPGLNGLLTFCTYGIWYFVWTYRSTKHSKRIVLSKNNNGSIKEEISPPEDFSFNKATLQRWGLSKPYNVGRALVVIFLISGLSVNILNATLTPQVFSSISETEDTEVQDLSNPRFVPLFGTGEVPWLVGRDAESAVVAFAETFGFALDRVTNIDTDETLRAIYPDYRNRDLREYEGLFVCSQSYPPGADPMEHRFKSLRLEVSKNCSGTEPDFLMGSAARLVGDWEPAPLGGLSDEGYATLVEGYFVEFLSEGYNAHKTLIVKTGFGDLQIELAMVDLARDWCRLEDHSALEQGALQARDQLFEPNMKVRLVKPKYLYGDEWFVHRLSEDGTPRDGEPPVGSTSELLVKSGYWVPDHSDVSYKIEDRYQNVSEQTWEIRESTNLELREYAQLLADAANQAKQEPNQELSSCLIAKQNEVIEARNDLARQNAEDQAERDRRNALYLDGGGGGKDCTHVRGHYRNGKYVRGHIRCR
jgi:hypothetical protein